MFSKPASDFAITNVRISRPTNDMDRLLHFYCRGLGFEVLLRFPEDSAGYSGAVLGHPGTPTHLEFCTHPNGFENCRPPTTDNLLVFYLQPRVSLDQIVQHMKALGYPPVSATNPHWETVGRTFEDPDGWRVVVMLRNNL